MNRSCRSAGSQTLLRHGQGLDQRARLVPRLLVLGGRVRVGDDARSGLDAGDAVADGDGANRDAEIEVAGEVEVADGAGIDVAAGGLELREDLHGADLRRPRDGAGREA